VNVRFCESCRSLVLADFRYCPYCGEPVTRGPGLEEALSDSFNKIEAVSKDSEVARLEGLREQIDRLEADMDLILSQFDTEIDAAPKK